MSYSDTTLKKLFALSGNECAYPGCSAPIVDGDSQIVVGEICHIKSKSPDGPRYDKTQSDKERNGYDNLILMCDPHNKIVDHKDTRDKYPVEILRELKKRHEERFRKTVIDKTDPGHFYLNLVNQSLMDSFINHFRDVDGSVIKTHNQSGGQTAHQITNNYGPVTINHEASLGEIARVAESAATSAGIAARAADSKAESVALRVGGSQPGGGADQYLDPELELMHFDFDRVGKNKRGNYVRVGKDYTGETFQAAILDFRLKPVRDAVPWVETRTHILFKDRNNHKTRVAAGVWHGRDQAKVPLRPGETQSLILTGGYSSGDLHFCTYEHGPRGEEDQRIERVLEEGEVRVCVGLIAEFMSAPRTDNAWYFKLSKVDQVPKIELIKPKDFDKNVRRAWGKQKQNKPNSKITRTRRVLDKEQCQYFQRTLAINSKGRATVMVHLSEKESVAFARQLFEIIKDAGWWVEWTGIVSAPHPEWRELTIGVSSPSDLTEAISTLVETLNHFDLLSGIVKTQTTVNSVDIMVGTIPSQT